MSQQLIECVPNFSEGRDEAVLQQIANVIQQVDGVKLLDMDPGQATNRTVFTFVGAPEVVVEAAFRAIKTASELIDMRQHQGEHPRMGATDVCPLIPVSDISMEETVAWANRLAERVGKELSIPVFLYESAATSPQRKNLATIRAGEYEGMAKKLKEESWQPDHGPAELHERAGVTAIGARDFLIAYNINLNTRSVRRANSVAFDVREKGRIQREGGKVNGAIIKGPDGEPLREAGRCKGVKAIGWFIEEYGVAQISMNITDISATPLHIAFEACRQSANERGLRVTGSELVGLVPLSVMLEAGRYFLRQQRRSLGVSEQELVQIAIKSLGLEELGAFDPQQKIIEYQLRGEDGAPLANRSLSGFADETASESMAPGGGSISAYVGALGAALAGMVANLSANRRVWDDRWEEFSEWAERAQQLKQQLMDLVDEDTRSFEGIIAAVRLPKDTTEAQAARKIAIQQATRHATEVPFRTMELCLDCFEVLQAMAERGNPNSASDAGVGALCARAAIRGAHLNVRINAQDLSGEYEATELLERAIQIEKEAETLEQQVLAAVEANL